MSGTARAPPCRWRWAAISEGKPVIADLAKMPHLLIAGATGAGKSVAINTIVSSLIYRYTAKQLRLLMVDPKMVELSMYNALPHMRHRVVTNNNEAAIVLKWAVVEMNRRYELLNANGARNLADFNKKAEDGKPLKNPARPKATLTTISAEGETTAPEAPEEEAYTEGALPLIVMIVDELADLMMTVQGEVETPLAMLAQKARAIGIHLILATQRPSVNVLTGLIKANFPSRIAFRVASKVDSRTILDQNGAEALLGNGDMLFLPPGKSEPMRLQGAYIATEETERVMDWFEARRAARSAAPPLSSEQDIVAWMKSQGGRGGGRRDGGVRGGAGCPVPRSRRTVCAEPGRVDVAPPAAALHRLRSCRPHRRSAPHGRHPRPPAAGVQQAARGADRGGPAGRVHPVIGVSLRPGGPAPLVPHCSPPA